MLRRIVVSLLLVISLAAPSFAGEKDKPLPQDLPPYGALKAFSAPQVTEKRLRNGLTLWLVPRPGFPKVALVLAVRGGMAADPEERPGLSEFLAASVHQGTRTRTARQIAEQMQAVGSDLSVASRADALVLSASVLSDKLAGGLSLMADVTQNATFPESEVEIARRNLSDSLRAREAQPRFLAQRALAAVVFAGHPYRVIAPTQDSIARTTVADLQREYARRFRPDQALLVAVGDFDSARFTAFAEEQFGKWKAPEAPAVPAVPAPATQTPHAVFAVARPGSVQTTLLLASFAPRRGEPDYVAAEVANTIYGGAFTSRLVSNIREDKGYTYSPGSGLQSRRAAGLLSTRADVRNEVTGATLNEIAYELNRMATTAPTEEELTRAQRYMVGTTAIELQSRAAVAAELAALWTYGLPPAELGREAEEVQKITAEQVESAGRKYYPLARASIVAVGEEKVVREQIEPFGIEVKPAP